MTNLSTVVIPTVRLKTGAICAIDKAKLWARRVFRPTIPCGAQPKIGSDWALIESMEQEHTPAPNENEEAATPTSQAAKKKILLVDDHPIFRHGLTELLDRQVDLVVCGHADSSPGALEQMRKLKPDLAILDITLRGTNGIELVKLMKAESPQLPILVLSMHDESLYALRALKAGALGYVMKADGVQSVLDAIYRALQGKLFVSQRLGEKLIFKAIHTSESDSPSPVDRLSDRELEVLVMLGRGHSTRSIAKEINLSVKTVETHRAHIKEKLGFAGANEMVRFAIDWVAHQELT